MYRYDQDTQLVREEYYDYPDFKYAYLQNDYDELGRLSKEQMLAWQGDSIYRSSSYNSYPYEGGRLESKTNYTVAEPGARDTTVSGSERYLYDTEGHVIKRYWMPAEGGGHSTQWYDTFIYQNGRLLQEYYYANAQNLYRAYTYEYDAAGRLAKKHIFDGISNNFEQTGPAFIPGIAEEYFYDDAGRMVKSIRYHPYFGYNAIELILYEYF